MGFSIAPNVQAGFSNASSYDLHRPSYPSESVTSLLKHLGVLGVRNARILDLAAGTGKFTSLLSAREEEYDIIAVEPHAEMREILEKKALKGVRVLEGIATDMEGVETGWADAVVSAQAFHWQVLYHSRSRTQYLTQLRGRFATIKALTEIHRTLRPGCPLGLIWIFDDYNARIDWKPSTVWEGKIRELIASSGEDSAPGNKHSEWPKVFDEQVKAAPATILSTANPLFSLPLGEETAKWTVWLSKEAVWERVRTISHMSMLRGEQLKETKSRAFDALNGDDIDTNERGDVALHGRTMLYWTTAIPEAPLTNAR